MTIMAIAHKYPIYLITLVAQYVRECAGCSEDIEPFEEHFATKYRADGRRYWHLGCLTEAV